MGDFEMANIDMLLYNPAPTRRVQPVFPLLNNIPILIVKICIIYSNRIGNIGIECTVCKDTYHYKYLVGSRSRGRGQLQN